MKRQFFQKIWLTLAAGGEIHYDLFGNGVTNFASICKSFNLSSEEVEAFFANVE